jgi:transaldolase / glucose-6-phosphate isomerase
MSKLKDLQAHGQSIWIDYIKRSMLTAGELSRLIDDGLLGLTSNPSIFEKAIAESSEYQSDILKLAPSSLGTEEIYEKLAITDIQMAADAFQSVYETTKGRDGFVSLEVSPEFSHDAVGTREEARRLWTSVGRKNLMVKVPGTPEGLDAFETLITEGINVNVTLLFSVSVYEEVVARYLAGLTRRAAAGHDVSHVASVASFFVSRVDTAVDALIEARIKGASVGQQPNLRNLLGKAAIANAKLAYARYQALFSGQDWKALESKGARTQRVLWASTGTKNPAYSDVLYLEELIGRDTVNTVPPATLEAFRAHGQIRDSLTENLQDARAIVGALALAGISMNEVTAGLLNDAQKLFVDAFRKMLAAVEKARGNPERNAEARAGE